MEVFSSPSLFLDVRLEMFKRQLNCLYRRILFGRLQAEREMEETERHRDESIKPERLMLCGGDPQGPSATQTSSTLFLNRLHFFFFFLFHRIQSHSDMLSSFFLDQLKMKKEINE